MLKQNPEVNEKILVLLKIQTTQLKYFYKPNIIFKSIQINVLSFESLNIIVTNIPGWKGICSIVLIAAVRTINIYFCDFYETLENDAIYSSYNDYIRA